MAVRCVYELMQEGKIKLAALHRQMRVISMSLQRLGTFQSHHDFFKLHTTHGSTRNTGLHKSRTTTAPAEQSEWPQPVPSGVG